MAVIMALIISTQIRIIKYDVDGVDLDGGVQKFSHFDDRCSLLVTLRDPTRFFIVE